MNVSINDWDNDVYLTTELLRGNEAAFNALFEKYWEFAYTTAYKRTKDADLAKDIVQDIFAHIWLHRDSLHIQNVPAYLNRAIRNKVIKAVTKQSRQHPFFKYFESLPGKSFAADNPILFKEFVAAYENLLATLPPQRQAIFKLRFHEDLATKEIADLLGLSRKTVQNQLGKAIEKLRVSLMHLWVVLLVFGDFLDK